jgi:malate/lactate dehydrogenase
VLEGEYGIEGVSVTVPAVIGRGGVEEIGVWELAADEAAGLRRSADTVRATAASVSPVA